MGILSEDESLEELEEKNQKAGLKLSIQRKKALIAESKKKHGKEWWKMFSSDGTESGINWQALKFRM